MPSKAIARHHFWGGVILAIVVAGVTIWRFQVATPRPGIVTDTQLAGSTIPTATPDPNLRLVIDKIAVSAPIILGVDTSNQATYLKAIEHGVAHYAGTSYPGSAGNTVIFGHSSYYAEKPGDYKEVFKRLNEVTKGDTLHIVQSESSLAYKVIESKIIKDDDFSVVAPSKKEIITILTCWPPGTITKRYLVQAERFDPSATPIPLATPSPTNKPTLKSPIKSTSI